MTLLADENLLCSVFFCEKQLYKKAFCEKIDGQKEKQRKRKYEIQNL